MKCGALALDVWILKITIRDLDLQKVSFDTTSCPLWSLAPGLQNPATGSLLGTHSGNRKIDPCCPDNQWQTLSQVDQYVIYFAEYIDAACLKEQSISWRGLFLLGGANA